MNIFTCLFPCVCFAVMQTLHHINLLDPSFNPSFHLLFISSFTHSFTTVLRSPPRFTSFFSQVLRTFLICFTLIFCFLLSSFFSVFIPPSVVLFISKPTALHSSTPDPLIPLHPSPIHVHCKE